MNKNTDMGAKSIVTDEGTHVCVNVYTDAKTRAFKSVTVQVTLTDEDEQTTAINATGTLALSAARLACRTAGMNRKAAAKLVTETCAIAGMK